MLGLAPIPFTIRLVETIDMGVRCTGCGNRLTIYTREDGPPYHWETDHAVQCLVRLLERSP